MFGGLTHRPATELAKLLVENAPEGLTKVWLLADLLGLGWVGAGWCTGRGNIFTLRRLHSIWGNFLVAQSGPIAPKTSFHGSICGFAPSGVWLVVS